MEYNNKNNRKYVHIWIKKKISSKYLPTWERCESLCEASKKERLTEHFIASTKGAEIFSGLSRSLS